MTEPKKLKIWTVIKWMIYSSCVGFFVLQGTLVLGDIYNCKNFGGSMELIACEPSQLFAGSFFGAMNIILRTAPVIFFASIAFLSGLTWEKRRLSRSQDNKKTL